MKDELSGKPMSRFVGLRAKMYAFEYEGQTKVRVKGVKASTSISLTFDDYRKCLLEGQRVVKEQAWIVSKKHQLQTIFETKIALSGDDDKRFIISIIIVNF
jgi:hypothetical protein